MLQTIKRRWPRIAAILLLLGPATDVLTRLLDWRSRYDAFTESLTEVGGFRAVVGYVLNPPPWFILCALIAGLALIYWDLRRRMPQTVSPSLYSQPASIAPASAVEPPKILFGENGSYETKVANGLYVATHTFQIGIKNENRDRFISNCNVYLVIKSASGQPAPPNWLAGPFTLNATEERLVPIVRYDEPASVSGLRGQIIQLMIPVIGGYYNVGYGWPWQLPIGTYVFTLRVTSMETGPCEVLCKVWVDDAGKLHFEKA